MYFDGLLGSEAIPNGREPTVTDVRDLPPPEPLQETMETLEEMDGDGLLIQVNDRQPQHLFPLLEERGFQYESSGNDPTYTAIWKP